MDIKQLIKNLLPDSFILYSQTLYSKFINRERFRKEKLLIDNSIKLHKEAIQNIRRKNSPINVVFLALMDSVWKYDTLYQLMEKDPRFNPSILVCPVITYGEENMIFHLEKCYNLFLSKGYRVFKSFDPTSKSYIDLRTTFDPDILFYTSPYEGLIDDRYYITNYPDLLTCYAPYSMGESKAFDIKFNTLFPNLLWKNYIEFPYLIKIAKIIGRLKGKNVVNTGYPGIDYLIQGKTEVRNEWKVKNKKLKKIIWAPHHTITDYAFVNYSTFLSYYEFMFELAQKYADKIQIAFKPHPLLRNRLEIMWGVEKTKKYYDRWKNLPNGILVDGAYDDLFITSDAIIHDSASFITEYLYTKKPAMFLSNGKAFKTQYNKFTQHSLKNYYIGRNKEEVEKFIVNIISGDDPLKEKRDKYYKEKLLPPHNLLASENIINDLTQELLHS